MSAIPPPASQGSDVESLRIRIGALIIVVALLVLLLTVMWALGYPKAEKVSDVVAIITSVTTFLGTAVGVIFGVHAGQAGTGTAITAAKAATDTAKIASHVADRANALTDSAMRSADAANGLLAQSRAENAGLQTTMRQAEAARGRSAQGVRDLYRLVKSEHRTRADRIVATSEGALDPYVVLQVVADIVTRWLADLLHEQAEDIDTSRKMEGDPPAGYGLTPGAYQAMCDECTVQINNQLASQIVMTGEWRSHHEFGTVGEFIGDAARLVIKG